MINIAMANDLLQNILHHLA